MGGGTNTHDFMRCHGCENSFPLRFAPKESDDEDDDSPSPVTGY
jgi:hypothetical protein